MAAKNESKKKVSFIPKLDSIDAFSILLWLAILVPAIQLPLDTTYTFPKSVMFILWLAVFLVYIALRVIKEKRLVFYSASLSRVAILGVAGSFILSYILSASSFDSLFGYNISFASSFIVSLSFVALYCFLRLAGLSLELQLSRIISALPASLLIADLISVVLFLIPVSVYQSLLGGYSQYFIFYTLSPFAILGNISQSSIIHLLAIIILIFQLFSAKKPKDKLSVSYIRKLTNIFILAIASSYLIYFTYSPESGLFGSVSIYFYVLLVAIMFSVIPFIKSTKRSFYALTVSSVFAGILLLGILWNSLGFVGGGATNRMISQSESVEVVKSSFMNQEIPIWRPGVGFGVGTFPYVYFQQRSVNASRLYGSETFFYKPSSYLTELFVENGMLGVLSFAFLLFAIVKAFIDASNKSYLLMEFTLLAVMVLLGFFSSSFILFSVLFVVTLASFFDKVESLPETLKNIRAVELRETLYTNRTSNRIGQLLLVGSIFISGVLLMLIIKPSIALFGYSRAYNRYNVANQLALEGNDDSMTTYNDALIMAAKYQKYCVDCSQLTLLQITTLQRMRGLYDGLTTEQKATNADLQRINNLIVQVLPSLTNTNSLRYDYWINSAQIYRDLSKEDSSPILKGQAIQSIKYALSVNPNSVTANYLYIDILLSLGNTTEVNTVIYNQLAKLKELVDSTPVQIQILDGIMLAREGNYQDSINLFTKIKDDVQADDRYTQQDKESILSLVDIRLNEVREASGIDLSTENNEESSSETSDTVENKTEETDLKE